MRRVMLLWPGAVCAVLALSACKQEPDARQEPPAAAPGGTVGKPGGPAAKPGEVSAPGAKVDEIKESPERYYGKTVRVYGSVDEVYGDRAFELEGSEWAFNDKIVVLTKTPVRLNGAQLRSDEELVIFGTVRPFVAAEVERDLGWSVGQDVTVKIKKRPVIIADTIRRVGEYGVWSATAQPEVAISNTYVIMATIDPKSLAGRKVDLGHERVQAVGGKGLWVGPSPMSQVFVLPAQPATDIKVGDLVHVTGTLQRAPKDAAKTWNLPPRMEGMFTEEMVFIDTATVTKSHAAPGAKPGEQPGRQNIQ